jgi:long-chain acyl-CoA synthetase
VIRHAVAAGSGSPKKASGDSAVSPLAELVARVTGRPTPRLLPDANLERDLGLSSLERVELLGALEDRYQVDLSETKFANAATVADVDKLLRDRRGHALSPGLSGAEPHHHTNAAESDAAADETRSCTSSATHGFHYPRWTLRWPATWLRLAAHYLLMRPAVFLLGRPRIIGRENLRGVSGPLLVVSNHIADVDIGLIQTALPARIRHSLATATRGEALEALRAPARTRPWFLRIYDRLQWVLGIALLNLFPLPREAGFRKSFAYAGEAVDRGYSILVFPEGRYTEDGTVQPFRTGIGLLANNLRVPVLPLRIDGLFDLKRAEKRIAAPGKIQIRIGKPVQFALETPPEIIAGELQKKVEDL